MARIRRRQRLFELLLPQLDELLNVLVVQIHGIHCTGRQERLAEGEYCRSRLGGNLTMFILRFHFSVVKTPTHRIVRMLFDRIGGSPKHIDPRGLRWHVTGKVRVFDQLRGLTGRP